MENKNKNNVKIILSVASENDNYNIHTENICKNAITELKYLVFVCQTRQLHI